MRTGHTHAGARRTQARPALLVRLVPALQRQRRDDVGAVPHEHNAFKIELAKRTLVRALTEVAA